MATALEWPGNLRGPKDLGIATLGTAWATLGTAIVAGARYLGAFMDVTINTSVDVRFRLRGQLSSGGSAYSLPLVTLGSSDVKVEDEYIEFNVDADQRQSVVWELFGVYPYVELQGSVGTAGGTAATLNACNLTTAV